MGNTPLDRIIHWVRYRLDRAEMLSQPPATVTACSWCSGPVQPGTGYWDLARRQSQCSEHCHEQHTDSWAI